MAARRRTFVTLLVIAAGMLAPAAAAAAKTTPLDPTPPMGFNDWNAYGCNVSAQLIESTARAMHTNGMQAAGYRYVNIDDCWLSPQRDAAGRLQADPTKFPQGIPAVARYVHHLGLKLGIYEDAGTATCAGYPGSLGHEQTDARTFASWGVDYLKYDQCNIPFQDYPGLTHEQIDERLYTTMSRALKATGRKIVFSMCNGTDAEALPWLWGAKVSNLWRTTSDISDNFPSTVANFTANAPLWHYAHAGAFNDPDMLEVGNGGQTTDEYRAQFSLWSEMAAPLIAGTNVTALSRADRAIYENRRVIAVDQDTLARQGHAVTAGNGRWTLTKPLAGGDRAVVLFNSTDEPVTMRTTARVVGARPASSYRLQDLWSGAVSESGGPITAFVPAHGVAMYRVHSVPPSAAAGAPPHLSLSLTAAPTETSPGAPRQVRVALADDSHAVTRAVVTLHPPAGWTANPATVSLGRVARGGAARTVTLTAPPTAPPVSAPLLRATAAYEAGGATGPRTERTTRASAPLALVSPLTAPYEAADTTGDQTTTGHSGDAFSIVAAGTGISPQSTSSHGVRPASDSYGAIDEPAAAAPSSTAQVTVTRQTGSVLRPYGTAGLIERAGLGTPNSPEGVALSVSTAGVVSLSWDARGGPVVDSTQAAAGVLALPVALRLSRAGTDVTGAFSTDGGATWVTVGTAQLAPSAAPGALDVGLFHASGVAGWDTEADFSGFEVN